MTPLRKRLIEDMTVRNFAPATQATYVQQVSLFARHFGQSPETLGPEEIRSYQLYLAMEKELAPTSISIAVSALRFLYNVTLQKKWLLDDVIPAPKIPDTLPVVLSPEEVLQFLEGVQHIKHRTILTVCYAAGPRISEAVHGPLEACRYRQPAHGHSYRAGQGAEGPVMSCFRFDCWRSCANGGARQDPSTGCFLASAPTCPSPDTPWKKRVRRPTAAAVFPNPSHRILFDTMCPSRLCRVKRFSPRTVGLSVLANAT